MRLGLLHIIALAWVILNGTTSIALAQRTTPGKFGAGVVVPPRPFPLR